MGKFLTALHVKTTGKEQFIEKFTRLMKKDGYVPCSEDEAAVSYAAAFSEGGWVTLSNGESTTTELSKTAKKIAEGMDTLCFTAEVVDSDFAILNLFAQNGSESRVIVGDGSGYGIEKAPFLADMWKPLIKSGDESEFVRALGLENTFVEDTLHDIGNILGITPSVMTWCYDEFEEEIGQDGNVISLSFRKAVEKKLSLNAAFKQVFGEALKPLGFKLIKSKYPYFVRVVPGGEIVHVITLLNEPSYQRGKKCFKIFGGIATVYRDEIDLTQNPGIENINWMRSNSRIAIATDTKYDFAYEGGFKEFLYRIDNESEMLYELRHSLDVTLKIMVPVISRAVDIYSSIECFSYMGMSLSFDKHFEGLLFLKTSRYADIFINELQKYDDEYKEKMEQQIEGYTPEGYEIELRKSKEVIQREVSPIDEVFANPNMLAEYMAELERRRAINTEKLRSYGLDI